MSNRRKQLFPHDESGPSAQAQAAADEDDDCTDILLCVGELSTSDDDEGKKVMSDYLCMIADNREKHLKRGKPLNRQARMIICNVLKYLRQKNVANEKEGIKKLNVFDETAQLCGVSKKVVQKIDEQAKTAPILITPNRKRKKRIVIDSFTVDCIRQVIHAYFKASKPFSSPELLSRLRSEYGFPYGLKTLEMILKQNGFR